MLDCLNKVYSIMLQKDITAKRKMLDLQEVHNGRNTLCIQGLLHKMESQQLRLIAASRAQDCIEVRAHYILLLARCYPLLQFSFCAQHEKY